MTFQPGTSSASMTTVVQLSISCRNLRDMDVFSKSDPMCVVYIQPLGSYNQWTELCRTETIQNNLNPDFSKVIQMAYLFEERQPLKFEVYDIDSSSKPLSDQDFIGECQCNLASIVSNTRPYSMELVNGIRTTDNGTLIVTCEESSSCKDDIVLQFMGKKLDRKDFFGSSDPFLEFHRSCESGNFVVVHRTEYHKRNRNPVWNQFTVPIRTLCNGDLDRNILVKCFDHNRNGDHSIIGEFHVTLRHLIHHGPSDQTIFPLINVAKKARSTRYKNSGKIHLIHCELIKGYSFLDYIRGGTELACTISIDFTASNGDPKMANSLHFVDPYHPNQYELALTSVGEIIEEYDSDKLFPVLGFGARLPPDGKISHLFFVNGHPSNPYCAGISGVLQAYKNCIRGVQLYGPTNFAPTIQHVANYAKNFKDGSQYFILLIITDGIISDMCQTKEAIVEAASLPMSIIIVGVGQADFENMEELDGDEIRLSSFGKVAARDIVQFVPFRKFLSSGLSAQISRLHLAKEVLAEIPDQFLSYMKLNSLVPKQPKNNFNTSNLPTDPELQIA